MLDDFLVTNLSTIKVIVAGADSAASHPTASAAAHTAPTSLPAVPGSMPATAAGVDGPILSDGDVPRAVIATGLPLAEPAVTEKALFDAFSRYGGIARVIFQDAQASPTGDGASQRAVIVFHTEGAAAAALAADGAVLLGSSRPIRVALASSAGRLLDIPMSGAHPAVQGGGSSSASAAVGGSGAPVAIRSASSSRVAHWLSQGYLYGHKGVAHVKAFDDSHELSARVKVVVDRIVSKAGEWNERYSIVPTVKATYAAAAVQAADLDRELGIMQRVSSFSSYALAKATEWTNIAMANPTVAASVTAAKDFVSQAAVTIRDTCVQARDEAMAMAEAERAAAASSTGAASGSTGSSGSSQAAVHPTAAGGGATGTGIRGPSSKAIATADASGAEAAVAPQQAAPALASRTASASGGGLEHAVSSVRVQQQGMEDATQPSVL